MKKQQEEDVSEEAVMSTGMISAIQSDIKKYKSFDDFLVSKVAMKVIGRDHTVLKFHIVNLSVYEEKFLKPYKFNLNDEFVFEKYAKVKKKNVNGKEVDSEFFIPALFWSYVEKQ